MDALLLRQNTIIKEIENIYINFKKDGASRKTPNYLTKRLEALDNLWGEFMQNDSNLQKYEDKTPEYFTKGIYDQIKQYYEGVRTAISNFKLSLSQSEDKGSTKSETLFYNIPKFEDNSSGNYELDEMLTQQRANFRALNRLFRRINIDMIEEKWEIEDSLKNMQHRWKIIDELHLRIDSILEGSNQLYEKEFSEIETTFEKNKKQLNQKLSSTAHLQKSVPQVDIPVFTGKYTQWPTFNDLFLEAIHNSKYLSNAQKMQHLKSKVKGEAERLIQHLHISNENYNTAWDILNHRYNNPQVLFTKQVDILLNQSIIHKQSSFELKRLYDTTTECIHAIHNLGVDTNTWDPLLVHILSKKLDTDTYADYKEARKHPRELPTMDEFMTFIEAKFTALEPIHKKERENTVSTKSLYQAKQSNEKGFSNLQGKTQFRKKYHTYQAAPTYTRKHITCPLCNLNHDLFMCQQFLSLSKDQIMDTITKHKICPNCLYKHYDKICISNKRCKECNECHNTLIHEAIMSQSKREVYRPSTSRSSSYSPPEPTIEPTSAKQPPRQHRANYVATDDEEILLTTVSIKIKSYDNTYVTLKALLDQGSQVSLISERATQLLGLQRKHYHASISGIGPRSKQSKGVVTLECQSIYNNYHLTTQALVISQVINNLPTTSFKKQEWSHLERIDLADPEYNVSKPIDLLLDASVYSEIIMCGLIKGHSKAPIAQQTRLGWILSGHVTRTFNCNVVINQLEDLSKYWELEDIQDANTYTALTKEEQYCEDYYQSTTRRLESGRYEVAIPMTPGFEQHLGSSKPKATAQFLQIERRMKNDSKLSEAYIQFMNEYEELNHMRKVHHVEEPSCYLPHHGVVKLDSTTTALRVVFNASSKSSSGRSLNDLMECGPNLQQDLHSLILKWRQYRYVLTADIEKMFRQITIRSCDQPLQTIIWRSSPHHLLQAYHLTTVTYGTKAAPFLAMRTLRQIANDNADKELAADALNHSFFMDDLLGGNDSLVKAKQLQNQLIEVLKSAGMNLRKWSSNEPELTQHLSADQLNTTYEFKDTESRKTLGLRWNPSSDTFSYQNKLDSTENTNITKRQFLSEISKIYDPIGWISPLTIRGKLLFQQTWASNLSWDENLSTQIRDEWLQLRRDLLLIETFAIPRYLGHAGQSLQLHGFCDASEKAYACAIYAVTQNNKGEYISTLLTAKTRVAPTKKEVSLPRLELLGALLLSQLMKKVVESLSASNIRLFAWTDSMIVLGWLCGDASKWKQFVANRVRQIIDIIPAAHWRHVRSEENAADCATRGLSTTVLLEYSLWWKGPSWLPTFNPSDNSTMEYQEPRIEVKSKHSVHIALQQNKNSFIKQLLDKYSSISRAAKTIAWVARAITRFRNLQQITYEKAITFTELQNAYDLIIRATQVNDFATDLSSLKTKGRVSPSSKLSSLNPFIDEKGILRVGGRLENAHISYSAKHPVIISSNSRFTELLIDQAHRTTLHGGPKLTLSYIRDKYWIVGGVRTVKKQLRRCVRCLRFKQETMHHIMADLPQPRVTPARPFTNTGVDFTGHVDIKSNKGRGIRTSKGYVAVFVCLSTKAVHLELVSDLSTAAFLAAFRRMTARRGTPKNIYSDNGTNFVGASRILKKEYQEIMQTVNIDLINDVSEMNVTWHFNAPSWPSAGGLWEAAVKSLKYHLKRVLGEQKLTYEEFTTLLYQIEACLNSRPLCSVTESPDDECLTPGHFLVGGPLISRPQTDPEIVNLSTRWELVQAMNKQIWKSWSKEYLQQLQTRSKWRKQGDNLHIGDIVIMKEDNMPPGKWAMARVCDIHPGADGNVRVVSLKTKDKIIKRPITKLIYLPVNDDYRSATKEKDESSPSKQDAEPETQSTSNTQHPPTRQLRPRRKIYYKNFFISALMLFMTIIPSSSQLSYKITSITGNNSLYFDKAADMQVIKDDWNMIVYYNMTTYWQSVANLENYINQVIKMCGGIDVCSVITSQLEHELKEMNHYNSILTYRHQVRNKRGLINAAGNIANALFGVLDDKFAEQYEHDIERIRSNENHMLNLLKNQTSVIEAENNIIHRNEKLMIQQLEKINYQFRNISEEVLKAEKMSQNALKAFYVVSNSMSINLIMSNLRRVQENLVNIITDIYQGHLDAHLLSAQQLQEQLNIISGQLSNELSIPIKPENIGELYELLRVKAKIKGNYLIIEMKIPLTTNAKYELDYIIPLPQKATYQTVYVSPIADYIAFDLRKDTFIPITSMDLLACHQYQRGKLLCGLNAPIYELKVEQSICDVKIITHDSNQTFCNIKSVECADRWVKLHSTDSWLYSCCEECTIRIMCPTGLTSQRIHGSGIITLGQDCVVKGDTFTLHGHHDYRSTLNVQEPTQTINLPQISQLNDFINTTIPQNILNIENHEDQFNQIQQQIDSVKAAATINDVPTHHVHHYVMIYVILSVTCIVTIIFVRCMIKHKWYRTTTNEMECQQPPPPPIIKRTAASLYAQPSTSRSMGDICSEIEKHQRLQKAQSIAELPPRRTVKFNPPKLI